MAVYKSAGKWRYRNKGVRLPDGRIIAVSGTPAVNTKAAAEQAEADRVALEIDRVRFPEKYAEAQPVEAKPALTFAEFWERRYYPTTTGDGVGTRQLKAQHARDHILPAVGGLELGAIGRRELDELRGRLMGPTDTRGALSAKTTRCILGTLGHALVMAHAWGDLDALPKMPKVRVEDPEWDHLTLQETRALIQAARDPRDRLLLLFAVSTGARAGEELALEWADLTLTPGAEAVRFKRSRRKDVTGPTKSRHHRSVPLPPALADALRAARLDAGARPLVFVDQAGAQLRLCQLHDALERTLKRAGLRRVRWHDLRHSFASHLVAAGVPLNVVQQRLGHSTIAMTMRYAHLAPDHHRHFVDLGILGQRRAKTSVTAEGQSEKSPSLN